MVEELDKAISEAQIDTKILIPEVGDMKYLFEIDSIAKTPDDIIHSMFYKDGQYSVLKFKNLFNCVAAHDYWSAYPLPCWWIYVTEFTKSSQPTVTTPNFGHQNTAFWKRMKKLLCQPLRNAALT